MLSLLYTAPLVQANWYFVLAVGLFAIGTYGIMTQGSGLKLLMSIEMLLNAANINFAAFASLHASNTGYVYALISIAIAAAEAAIGLAILVNLFRLRNTIQADEAATLRW